MAKWDDAKTHNQIKAYPRGSAQGGRAIQAVKGGMSDNDGTSGHRTIVRETSEGRAIARTRDEMPMVEVEKVEEGLYLESGCLEFLWPGDGNQPHSGDCAKWRFLDTNPAGEWLGEVDADGAQITPQRTPIDTGELRDNIDSLAIGYERSNNLATDYENKEDAKPSTVAKKVTVSLFPASLWSGKMRLFMQSLYGAEQDAVSWKLRVDIVGTQPVLRYENAPANAGEFGQTSVQFGMWSHLSPGILTTSDGNYWLLVISGGPTFDVDAYRITIDAEAAYELPSVQTIADPVERSKVEAYIFAHSVIDIGSKYRVGSYATGFNGAALAYGWKFNTDGSKASVVLHQPSGAHGDYHIKTKTIHLEFAYTRPDGQPALPNWITMAGSAETHPDWIDGWGGYNIFVPESYGGGGRLECWSYAMQWRLGGVRPNFSYAGAVVYGYYKDDVWKTVTMGRNYVSYTEESRPWTLDHSGLVFNSYANPETDISAWEDAFWEGMNPWSFRIEHTREMTSMSIAFDGYSFSGSRKYADTYQQENSFSSPVFVNTQNWLISQYGTGPACEYQTASTQAFISVPCGTYSSCPDINGNYFNWLKNDVYGSTRTMVQTTTREYQEKVWALIIPTSDAEAVTIVRTEHVSPENYTKVTTVSQPGWGNGFQQVSNVNTGAGLMDVTVYCNTTTWWPEEQVASTTTDVTPPDTPWLTSAIVFNQAVTAQSASAPTNAVALFQVDYNYPYYDPGMYSVTSFNERYWHTLNVKSPGSVPDQPTFVGWA